MGYDPKWIWPVGIGWVLLLIIAPPLAMGILVIAAVGSWINAQ